MALDFTKAIYIHRLSLIHQTDLQSAEAIISSQKMLPGTDGSFGGGIYFANTIEAASQKAHRRGVYLIADVYLGKVYPCPVDQLQSVRAGKQQLIQNGYKGVIGYRISNGKEIIAYNSDQVFNIKYCYGPQRPNARFITNRERLTLFVVTNHMDASNIVSKQQLPKTKGPFGKAFYLFDTLTDALTVHPNEETFLVADVFMKDYLKLEKIVDVESRAVSRRCRTFMGTYNNINYFIIKDPSLIKNIHYCGGKNW
ncbi:hypothetical protein M9Y10_007727 [Tritrichomonas musculus]|uniref:PARP catalytic domain-containing protein n=1 Tax=Tritrichomonas musculus TaxID=1915356 RepID=A0ABR2J338_9EUKA